MRIISGALKGKSIHFLKSQSTRPLKDSVKENILRIDGVEDVELKLVWDPPWTKEKMSEAAKLELNI